MTPPHDPPRPEFDSDDLEPKAKELILTSLSHGASPTGCPNCGKNSYSWGSARGHYDLKYIDGNAGFWSKNTVFGGQAIRARKCNFCRNIQLFAIR